MVTKTSSLLSVICLLFLILSGVGLRSTSAQSLQKSEVSATDNWPSFRGPHASGVAEGQKLPDVWNGETGQNIKWKVEIPGLAHSSPVIWGDQIFVTSAVSSRDSVSFKHGLYGEGTASEDRSVQRWIVLCLDKKTGKRLWQQTAHEGVPQDKRHIKATYANSSPATDGRYVIAWIGSEGLFAFDMSGQLKWKKDLGRLNMGAYDVPSYEWGAASSPIIYEDLVIVQCDTQDDSFLMACDIHSGETRWKTERDELPSWGTPTIYPSSTRIELVTNGANFIRSYDPMSGEELWWLGGSSKITAPTPIFSDDIIVVASGRRPEKPIFAIRSGASGQITLADNQPSSQFVLWHKSKVGPYMPTPVIYGGLLYVLQNQGILDCYDLKTGKEFYRERLRHAGGGFSASPVAADNKLYLSSEDGQIFVVQTGEEFVVLAENEMGERLMATPALSEGLMYVRAEKHLFAVGGPGER